MEKVIVEFLKTHGRYVKGDVAGFTAETVAAWLIGSAGCNSNAPFRPPHLEPLAGEFPSVVGVKPVYSYAVRAGPRVVRVHGQVRVTLRAEVVHLVDGGEPIVKTDYVAMSAMDVWDARLIDVVADAAGGVGHGHVRLGMQLVGARA